MARFLKFSLIGAVLVVAAVMALKNGYYYRALYGESPHRVYVILGFHTNFYHSWRGDTPDEAGFGTDIRIVREILRVLEEANAQGLDARAYWEGDTQFTFESIIPEFAPDIIDGIRKRVRTGQDEIVIAPYNNGLFSAMSEEEVRASIRWAISNPWKSGARDLFGDFTPLLRPQEGMFTAGLIPILRDEGIDGVILAYSGYPFTTFSNFVPPLKTEERYNATRFRMSDEEKPMLLFPCVSAGDVVDHVSIEKWLLELRELQVSGDVDQDLVIHINFDADAETWVPLDLPWILKGMPNTGGLREYIDAVNKYPWASFSTPREYLAKHEAVGEIVIRQDTADGAWDGYASWSEKFSSQVLWSDLQKARLYTDYAAKLSNGSDVVGKAVARELGEGRGSSFHQRLRALSTTHFGMSTPMLNEERQAAAKVAVDSTRSKSLAAYRVAAAALRENSDEEGSEGKPLYAFLVQDVRGDDAPRGHTLIRFPVILAWPSNFVVKDEEGAELPFIVRAHPENIAGAFEVIVLLRLAGGERRHIFLYEDDSHPRAGTQSRKIANRHIALAVDEEVGVRSLKVGDHLVGSADFLQPFVSYVIDDELHRFDAGSWKVPASSAALVQDIAAIELQYRIPMREKAIVAKSRWMLPSEQPWLVVDVEVDYPYTEKRDLLDTPQQKLRQVIDRRWREVAPFALRPRLRGDQSDPLRVWKTNYVNAVSWYSLNYASINPANASWDSFNHQVTAAWMAIGDGGDGDSGTKGGLLLAQSPLSGSSLAFATMRLSDEQGRQEVEINPFGSYFGEQMDYSHFGGNGLGRDFAIAAGAHLRPNAPSFNGVQQRFSLLIAPYVGAEPSEEVRRDAELFFKPPAIVYLETPSDTLARVPEDVEILIRTQKESALAEDEREPSTPLAFLASPTDSAVDVIWDSGEGESPEGFELQWKVVGTDENEWSTQRIVGQQRFRIQMIENGSRVAVRLRAFRGDRLSQWTKTSEIEVAPVGTQSAMDFAEKIRPKVLLRTARSILSHLLTTP